MSECEPFSIQSFRSSNGVTSSTMVAPAASHAGRPATKLPEMTHSANGSVGTGEASS